jgi:hypothetical protein
MIGGCVGVRLAGGLEIVKPGTLSAIAAVALTAVLAGCAASPAASPAAAQGAPSLAAAAPGGGCTVDAMKICKDAQAAGTLEAAPAMGMGATQAAMPRTAHLEIPGGPTVQAMCYYDPQHNTVTRADWTATATLDAKAIAYLQSKKLCAGP